VLVFRLTNRPGTGPERTAGRAYLPFGVIRRYNRWSPRSNDGSWR